MNISNLLLNKKRSRRNSYKRDSKTTSIKITNPNSFILENKNDLLIKYHELNKPGIIVGNIWKNLIYEFSKINFTKHVPVITSNVENLINSYINMYSKKYENKIKLQRTRFRMRFRRLSINKLFISKLKIKHTNSKLLIYISIFNPERYYLLKQWKKIRIIKKLSYYDLTSAGKLSKKTRFWRKKFYTKLKKNFFNLGKELNLILYQNRNSNKNLTTNMSIYYSNIVTNVLSKVLFTRLKYKYLLSINKLKFSDLYLDSFSKLLHKLYNKNVEFNLINIKNHHLNSDIFTKILSKKIRNRKNNVKRLFKIYSRKFKNPYFYNLHLQRIVHDFKVKIQNNSDLVTIDENSLFIPYITIINSKLRKKYKVKNILSKLENKNVTGLRLEGSGRLSKRLKALRAMHITKTKGYVKNTHSSKYYIHSPLIRGFLPCNIQYSMTSYKSRTGAYGIKGWVGSY